MPQSAIDPSNPRCFFDVTIRGELAGRLLFELFENAAPQTVENFRALCTGECGKSEQTERPLHYKHTTFYRILPGQALLAGDISAKGDGSGGESVFGESFPPENYDLKHERAGLLSMELVEAAGTDDGKEVQCSVASRFALTLGKAPERDGRGVIFGRLIRGYGALREIETVVTGNNQQPLHPVEIVDCGQLEPEEDGLVMGSDGDPFPPWPQDYPNMGDKGQEYLTRLAASETIRSFGNE
eukprot:gene17919-21336_t